MRKRTHARQVVPGEGAPEYVPVPRWLAERLLGIAEYYGSPHAEELQEILNRPSGDFTSLGE